VYVEANLALEEPTLLAPQGRVTTIVYHLGGADAARGSHPRRRRSERHRAASATNDAMLSKGGRWIVDLRSRRARREERDGAARVPTTGAFVYASATADAPARALRHDARDGLVHARRGGPRHRFANAATPRSPPAPSALAHLASGGDSATRRTSRTTSHPVVSTWNSRQIPNDGEPEVVRRPVVS